RRPVLEEIANKYEAVSLKDYVKNYWETAVQPPEKIFLSVLSRELAAVYGKDAAASRVAQLEKKPLVSTIDHHGIWNHPFFVNSDLIYSLNFEKNEAPLVLATESVSLNNTSSWSGSLLWHNDNAKLMRKSFFPDRIKTLPVFSAPGISNSDLARFQNATQNRFKSLIEVLGVTSSAQNFSSQACQASSKFWQAVFPSAPKLSYFPLETLVSKYLLEIFKDEADILSKLILTAPGRKLWQENFSSEHTFMFWGIDSNGRRQALNDLPKNKQELFELISQRKIYPSSPLCFSVLLKAGITCAGGFNQTTWLSQIKEKLIKLFSDLDSSNLMRLSVIPTQNFAESSLAWLEHSVQYITPTAVDLFLTGKDYYANYVKLAEALTFGQSLELSIPAIYEVVIPKTVRSDFNQAVCQEQIFKELNIAKLLKEAGI
ncbi:MAG TPA: hypothetical protein VE973_01010, partial [Candidatus Limnocylindria bacterium]|nr:hypothetical protein [Candidatus Limnocylindria bacterium]